jgi:hypothetical protein
MLVAGMMMVGAFGFVFSMFLGIPSALYYRRQQGAGHRRGPQRGDLP